MEARSPRYIQKNIRRLPSVDEGSADCGDAVTDGDGGSVKAGQEFIENGLDTPKSTSSSYIIRQTGLSSAQFDVSSPRLKTPNLDRPLSDNLSIQDEEEESTTTSSSSAKLVKVRLHNKRTGSVREYLVEKGTPMSQVLSQYSRDRKAARKKKSAASPNRVQQSTTDIQWHVVQPTIDDGAASVASTTDLFQDFDTSDHPEIHSFACNGCFNIDDPDAADDDPYSIFSCF